MRWCFDKCRQRPLGVSMNRVGSTGARGGPVCNGRPALGGEGGGGGPPKKEAVVGRQKYNYNNGDHLGVCARVCARGVLLLCLAVGVQSKSPDDRLCTLRVVDDVPGEKVDLVLQEGHTPLKTVGSHLPVGFLL